MYLQINNNKSLIALLVITAFLQSHVTAQNPNFSYPEKYSRIVFVSRVIDGDTFVLPDSQRVRMLGVNCPEIARQNKPADPYAYQAAQITKCLIENRKVKLTFDGRAFDMFGRLLAYVWLIDTNGKDSLFIQAELLKKGFAGISYYTKQKRYFSLFYNLRNTARKNKLGIWSIQ